MTARGQSPRAVVHRSVAACAVGAMLGRIVDSTPTRIAMVNPSEAERASAAEQGEAHPPVAVISRSRLETLYDGIFAIAMTLLVLDLQVPELADRHSAQELGAQLAHDGPTFFSYLLTFVMLGIMWYRHNLLYRHLRTVTKGILALHLLQLAAATSFPFVAALLGRYPTNGLAQVVYVGCVLIFSWASFATLIAAKRSGSLAPEFVEGGYAAQRARSLRGSLVVSLLTAVYLINMSLH